MNERRINPLDRIKAAVFVGTTPDPGWPTAEHPECVRRAEMVMATLINAGFVIVPRTPTEAMMQAGMNAGQAPLCDGEIRHLWETLIDAALNPEPADA